MADQSADKKRGCLGSLGYFSLGLIGVMVLAAIAVYSRAPSGDNGPASAPIAVPSGVAAAAVPVGSEGFLERPGELGVWMANSIGDYRALVEAERKMESADRKAQAEGKMSRLGMGFRDRIKIVLNGTRVRVTGAEEGGLKVEALDGKAAGRSGWVQAVFVKTAP